MDFDLEDVNDVLADYFGIAVPSGWLVAAIETEPELVEELAAGATSDTYVRELLIGCVGRQLGVKVSAPNIFGLAGSHEWPCYGDTAEYKAEFELQFKEKLTAIGGEFYTRTE